nr:MAG TPA: hypothetical protein [Caudoviricetes sp.]
MPVLPDLSLVPLLQYEFFFLNPHLPLDKTKIFSYNTFNFISKLYFFKV